MWSFGVLIFYGNALEWPKWPRGHRQTDLKWSQLIIDRSIKYEEKVKARQPFKDNEAMSKLFGFVNGHLLKMVSCHRSSARRCMEEGRSGDFDIFELCGIAEEASEDDLEENVERDSTEAPQHLSADNTKFDVENDDDGTLTQHDQGRSLGSYSSFAAELEAELEKDEEAQGMEQQKLGNLTHDGQEGPESKDVESPCVQEKGQTVNSGAKAAKVGAQSSSVHKVKTSGLARKASEALDSSEHGSSPDQKRQRVLSSSSTVGYVARTSSTEAESSEEE